MRNKLSFIIIASLLLTPTVNGGEWWKPKMLEKKCGDNSTSEIHACEAIAKQFFQAWATKGPVGIVKLIDPRMPAWVSNYAFDLATQHGFMIKELIDVKVLDPKGVVNYVVRATGERVRCARVKVTMIARLDGSYSEMSGVAEVAMDSNTVYFFMVPQED